MEKKEILNKLKDCIGALDFAGAQKAVREAIENNIPPTEIIINGVSKGGETVGDKFKNSEYFLSELLAAGEITKEVLKILEPYVKQHKVQTRGKVIIGTVEGDVHDIGKNIVIMFLQSRGFEVVDLGVDVPREDFIRAVKENETQILAMSALMTMTAPEMGGIIMRLKELGLRDKVKVIIGGAPTTPEFGEHIGADFQTMDPLEGVEKCLEWVKK